MSIYVILYCEEEGSSLIWAGTGKAAAVTAVQDIRADIEESERAHLEILGSIHPRDWSKIPEETWNELTRRQGGFEWYHDPNRVCVRKQESRFKWKCCCDELGVWIEEEESP